MDLRDMLQRWLLILCCAGTWLACTRDDGRTALLLERAEEQMEAAPDSALLLLCRIQHPEQLTGKQQADYALLLTQARDKNYQDSLQSDSLALLAVDYYRTNNNRVKRGIALYYYAKVLAMQGEEQRAMQLYLEAQTALEGTREYKMLGLLQNGIGCLNDDWKMYEMALANYRKAAEYYEKAGDTVGIAYIFRDMAWIYEDRGRSDSAYWYVAKGVDLLQGDSLSPLFPSLMQLQGEIAMKKGNYEEAIECLRFAIRHEKVLTMSYYSYLSLSDVYMCIGQLDKAEECLDHVLTSASLWVLASGYNHLYRLEKQKGIFAKALAYKERADSLWEVSQNEEARSSLLAVQRKHEFEKWQLEKLVLQQEKRIQFYLWSLLFIGFVLLMTWIYRRIKKQYRKIYRLRLQEHTEMARRKIADNERMMGQYICQIEDLKQKEQIMKDAAGEQIGKLRQEILLLHQENKRIREDSCEEGIKILTELREHQLIIKNMTPVEKVHLFEYTDLLFDGFVTRLREEYKLKDVNLPLPVLIKLGFSAEELAFLFDCEVEAVWKRKQRFKGKLGLDGAVDLDSFLLFYPRKCPVK